MRVSLISALVLALCFAVPSPSAVATATYHYGDDPEQTVDVTVPDGSPSPWPDEHPWLMVVHGGSWAAGSKNDGLRAQRVFTAAGFVVFNIEYRKVTDYASKPGIPWVDQRADVLAALDWAHLHAQDFGADPSRGAIYGFSAGGQLAAAAGLYGKGTDKVQAVVSASGVLQPHRVVDVMNSDPTVGHSGDKPTATHRIVYGWESTAMRCPMVQWNDCAARWNDFKPETHISADDPPMFIFQGTADAGVPPATGRAFQYWMRKGGLEAELVECVGWGHTEACAFDGGQRQEKLVAWVKSKTA